MLYFEERWLPVVPPRRCGHPWLLPGAVNVAD
jgi:hypothetical protein